MLKREAVLSQFERAVQRPDEVLREPKNSIVRDSAIQRFEFCLDLAWKSVKAYLEDKKGWSARYRRTVFARRIGKV